MQVTTYDNGDIAIEGYDRVTPEGCPAQVFRHPTADIFITLQCQCLEPSQPWQATILNCPQYGDLLTTTGTVEICNRDPELPDYEVDTYEGLDAWLTKHLGHP